ncbi:MAG: hypothetical protein HZB51_25430 [Chloroflexi bacterium]|nr:hypothetical protein [Chloroflexota bacterium]
MSQHTLPEQYIIRVEGHLSASWSEWFEGMMITQTESGETILQGSVEDQAALHGLLAKIRDLNLTIVSVARVKADPPTVLGEQP